MIALPQTVWVIHRLNDIAEYDNEDKVIAVVRLKSVLKIL